MYEKLLKDLYNKDNTESRAILRYLCRTDLYFLLRYIFHRPDVEHPWLQARCREVQTSPNGHLDLWSREHYKSTIITFAKSIQDILSSHGEDPLPEWGGREVTIGIFSHSRPISKKFLIQIKMELEGNDLLKSLFPDILYENPQRDAPKWSEDGGLVVKRQSNPREATVEAWGLVDGQPTSMHFFILVYDDVVVRDSVTTPEMIQKTTQALEESYNLGVTNGGLRRFIGTRWHYNDSYRELLSRGTVIPRIYPATENGEFSGRPVMWDRHTLAEKIRDMGPYTAACQLMQNPGADKAQGFKRQWLRFYSESDGINMNRYLIVDPANEKKKGSDYTAMGVIGLAADGNYYLLDAIYDRLNLSERTDALFAMHRRWKPIRVGYEKYGKDTDIEHIQYVQDHENYHFDIEPLGGRIGKTDRIRRLIPIFADQRFYFPESLLKIDYEGKTIDIIEKFLVEEYDPFPVSVHDDFLDMLARITDDDMDVIWPGETAEIVFNHERYVKPRYQQKSNRTWKSL